MAGSDPIADIGGEATIEGMGRRLVIVAILAGSLGIWTGWAARSSLVVDSCLDGGGRWAEHGDRCEGVAPQ